MDKVEILWAIEQIKQLKARYCRLADTRQDDLFLALFTDDLEWTLYSEDGTQVLKRVKGRDDYRQWRASHRATRLAGFSVHHVHMPEIEILDENHAQGVWPLMDYLRQPDKDKNYVGYGHYHEEYRREPDGQWRIAAVRVTRIHVDQMEGGPSVAEGRSPSQISS